MNDKHITSLQNPTVKQVVHLRDRHEREKSRLFLIEGYREILRASDAGWTINTLLTCTDLFLGTNEGALIQELSSPRDRDHHLFRKGVLQALLQGSPRWISGNCTAEILTTRRF